MSVENVRKHLEPFGKADQIMEFSESSATVELAAQKVGTEPARIAKTLAFYDPDDPGRAVLIVAAGDSRMHNGSFKRLFGGKPRMLAPDDVAPLTGFPIGGVCPFANPEGTRVFLDRSLQRFDVVFPAAGSASSAVPMTLAELEQCSGSLGWVEVTRGWPGAEIDS
ncbi:MAG: YbaK/EbsC family protein [Trueperaceae bacterium]